MDVRAAVARAAGEPLEVDTVQLDGPREGEVMVEIKATGVCHTDEYTLSGADPEGLFPAILGHEGAGVVTEAIVDMTDGGVDYSFECNRTVFAVFLSTDTYHMGVSRPSAFG